MVELLLIAWLIILGFMVVKLSISTVFKLVIYITIASVIISLLGW